jgi:hypothetical protein
MIPIDQKIAENDTNLAMFQTLKMVQQTADFSTVATGQKNVNSTSEAIEYKIEAASTPEDGPYILTRKSEKDTDKTTIAKYIKFAWFKRVPRETVKTTSTGNTIIYGTGPSVVVVHLEFENQKIGKTAESGYRVVYDTSFRLRGSAIH